MKNEPQTENEKMLAMQLHAFGVSPLQQRLNAEKGQEPYTSCGQCTGSLANYDWAECLRNGCGYSREFTVYRVSNPPPIPTKPLREDSGP